MNTNPLLNKNKNSSFFLYWLGKIFLNLSGWKIVGTLPPVSKYVVIGAPHTTNWDFVYMLVVFSALRIKISWMGKHTIFKKPFGKIMHSMGGFPINREKKQNAVDQVVDKFKSSEQLFFVLSPPGTRKKTNYWKSGFYWIAYKAQVPIVCGFLDYKQKKAGFGPAFIPTGNVKNDMDRIRDFYKDIVPKYPEQRTIVKLTDE